MADISGNMGAVKFFNQTLGSDTVNTDYHRQYLFKVVLPNISARNGSLAVNGDIVTYFISATQAPTEKTGIINVDWLNIQNKLAGRTTYDDWQVTVRDDASGAGFNYFKEWRVQAFNAKSGQTDIPKNYKVPLDLVLLKNDGSPSRGYTLLGAWPSSIGQQTFDHNTEQIVTFPITIAFDTMILGPGV